MTISIKHAFTSAKGDPPDTTLVRPSNWNAEHLITLATDKLLGRSTAGSGAVEEIACTSFGRSLIAAANLAALQAIIGIGFTTGDVKATLKSSADSGWVMMNDGTIGDASSSATTRANADTSDLFTLLWNNVSDSYAAVSGGRGGSAAADFAAHKRIALPKALGRALAGAGAGSGLTNWSLGQTTGEEEHTLDYNEMPEHDHIVSDGNHSHEVQYGQTTQHDNGGTPINAVISMGVSGANASTNTGDSGANVSVDNAGGGQAHNNMQPSFFLNFMVKL